MSELSSFRPPLCSVTEVCRALDHVDYQDEADALGIAGAIATGEFRTGYEALLNASSDLRRLGRDAVKGLGLSERSHKLIEELDTELTVLHQAAVAESVEIATGFVQRFPGVLCRGEVDIKDGDVRHVDAFKIFDGVALAIVDGEK